MNDGAVNDGAVNDAVARSNPFATRFTRPGRIPFLFPTGHDVPSLVDRLCGNRWWGEIVGPHGSGKSTLLAALLPAIASIQRKVALFELHDGQRRLPADLERRLPFDPSTQVVIDGYEQLSRWQRMRIKRRCRLAGCGLLVTAHTSVGLPQLYSTRPNVETAVRIVRSLLTDHPGVIQTEEIERAFHQQYGDVREMLFALYDVYERRR